MHTPLWIAICLSLFLVNPAYAQQDPEAQRAAAAAAAAQAEDSAAPPEAENPNRAPATQTIVQQEVAEEAPAVPGEEGQYQLIMMNGRGHKNTRVPALILDTHRGIVWTCQNIQDGKPLWVKTDLGRNGDKVMNKKKYVTKMLEWQNAALRMPAVVLDTEEGVVWNCPNIIDANATWIRKNLNEADEVVVQ